MSLKLQVAIQKSRRLIGAGISPCQRPRKHIHEPYNTAFLLQENRDATHLKKEQHAHADGRPRRGKSYAQRQWHAVTHGRNKRAHSAYAHYANAYLAAESWQSQ